VISSAPDTISLTYKVKLKFTSMKGVHGTTAAIAQKIQEEGFKPSSFGRAGSGVYFWRYFSNDEYAKYLAHKWWEFCNKTGNYNKINGDKRCCFIVVKFQSDSLNLMDFSHGLLRENIRTLILNKLDALKSISDNNLTEEEIISGLFSTYVKKIEYDAKVTFDAIIADVPPPKGATGKVGKYVGSCAEAIVVMNLDIIQSIEYTEAV